ncbi:hypothetical protein EYS09_03840 [Streptomyces kasugaensis]|uniref:PKD domain-containing protein n=1 Tax=Streptomyces kasugaensis TaxID=1946 RepID=A0A4V2JJ27_STRKA|nr:hypothetical protein [Streptomyces kasugaensis]TBO60911.1 hypothetical protein EYS09_03840 [Streptomyces kasugaensis]
MAGPTTIDWGDGSAPEDGPEKGDVSHKYTSDGPKTIVVTDTADPSKKTEIEVTIPLGGTPKATAVADPADAAGRTAKVTWSGFPAGTVSVGWGDGTPPQTGQPAAGTLSHAYAAEVADEQTITVTSEANDTKKATAVFTPADPVPDPSVTAGADPGDATGRTAAITLANFRADGAVSVNWGDGSAVETVPAGTTAAKHLYAAGVEGEQTIIVTSATDASQTATAKFTPAPGAPAPEPSLTATADEGDAAGRTVAITLAGFPADGAVNVAWGDGSAAEEVPAGTATAAHAYVAGVEGEQTITATSATDETKKATAKFTPKPAAEPSVTAEPDASDTTGHTATIALAGFPADSAVSVNWGDGTAAEEIAAGTTTGKHAYAAEVTTEQTITAASAGDAAKTASAKFTPGAAAAPATVARKKK